MKAVVVECHVVRLVEVEIPEKGAVLTDVVRNSGIPFSSEHQVVVCFEDARADAWNRELRMRAAWPNCHYMIIADPKGLTANHSATSIGG